jgi:hypothetical protein
MSEPLTIPTADQISERIRACRAELAALRKLQRLARAAQAAHEARQGRHQPAPNAQLEEEASTHAR